MAIQAGIIFNVSEEIDFNIDFCYNLRVIFAFIINLYAVYKFIKPIFFSLSMLQFKWVLVQQKLEMGQ